jgi:hypothetical protein
VDAKLLMDVGYGFVCATCAKLHRSVDAGDPMCEAGMLKKWCAGPISGGGFPLYEPMDGMSRGALARYCFRCGGEAVGGFSTPDGMIGVCEKHRGDIRGECRMVRVENQG